MASRSLYEHIASDAGIARYTAQAQRLLRYQRHLEAVLPPALRPHVHVANLRADKLVIYASNAVVASKLRQFAPRLAGTFASEGVKLTEIDVRVQVGGEAPVEKIAFTPKPLPSVARQEALARLMDTFPETSVMKDSLRRLLNTVKGR